MRRDFYGKLMPYSMALINSNFIEEIIRTGDLAQAQTRALNGTAQPQSNAQWDQFSTWALICEEILDTEQPPDWYDAVLAELTRRGFDFLHINKMRRFAWQTAGWLNYELMLWDWVSLNEEDILRALDMQLQRGLISQKEHAKKVQQVRNPQLV
jgi:hypothetical protein